jgi:UMF1 family MFS transporter
VGLGLVRVQHHCHVLRLRALPGWRGCEEPPAGWPNGATLLGLSLFIAGVFVFALAPVTGQRADAGGHRKRSLAIWSGLVIASTIGMFFILDDYHYLLIGLALLAAGSVFLEFAQVSYNAMLQQISNPGNIGKIPGIGWGAATSAGSSCCCWLTCCSSSQRSVSSG